MPLVSRIDDSRPADFNESRLEKLALRIEAAHERICMGGNEWIEGSLDLATALSTGRETMPANIAFSDWIKQRKLDFFNKNDRAALIEMASDIGVARAVMSKTKSRSYELILREFKTQKPMENKEINRVPINRKTRQKKAPTLKGRAMLHRRQKLGDELIDKIKDTSLDTAKELDELVVLNRGAKPGEHTEAVKQLVADAVAGKPVSACAHASEIGPTHYKKHDLIAAWKKRMVFTWALASKEEHSKLFEFIMANMDPDERSQIADILMDQMTRG